MCRHACHRKQLERNNGAEGSHLYNKGRTKVDGKDKKMGMAASQARFLGLTARKTNVEYEGQQINQQRTTLSNQTANYYNQLLGMSVPVPPSVEDFTKTVYTFEDGSLTNSISSMIAQSNGEYLISYTSSWVDDFAAVAAASSIVTKTDMNKANTDLVATDFQVGAKILRNMNDPITFKYEKADGTTVTGLTYSKEDGFFKDKDGAQVTFKDNDKTPEVDFEDEYLKTLSADQISQLQDEEKNYIQILIKQYGGTEDDWAVRYVQNTTTGTWSPYFTKMSVLTSDNTVYSDTGSSLSNIPMYTIGSAQKTEEVKGINARFEQDATGRLISVTLKPGEDDQVTYAVTTNTITDQAKYDDAMNQYEYDKYQYDQSIQEINAKIEIIQSEDKNLELRLKQLDTEQDAIQTEMDAVQKVIEKNTESTFKTFG